MKIRGAWFLPRNVDVLGRLTDELRVVEQVLATVLDWSRGEPADDAVGELRGHLKIELEQRRLLNTAVRRSFMKRPRFDAASF